MNTLYKKFFYNFMYRNVIGTKMSLYFIAGNDTREYKF